MHCTSAPIGRSGKGLCLAAAAALAAFWSGAPARAQGSAFDPSGFIEQKAATAAEAATSLRSQGIYRINGQRFHKLTSNDGSVYLPGAGSLPEIHEEFAVCEQHLKLMTEVLRVRDGLPVDREVKKSEAKIIAMIRRCREGSIKGPVVTIETADGAVLEMKAKEKQQKRLEKEERN
jgi:hypothetical protein